jgi:hypothetical protein
VKEKDKTMILKRFMIPALALMPIVPMLVAAGPGIEPAAAAPILVYGQEPWEVPPGEFNDIQRRGFHDGIEGARKDYGNHRRPDVDNREEYRNSDLPPDLREPYRAAFRRGYQMAASPCGARLRPLRRPRSPSLTARTGTNGARAASRAMPSTRVIAKVLKLPIGTFRRSAAPIRTITMNTTTLTFRPVWPTNTAKASCAVMK